MALCNYTETNDSRIATIDIKRTSSRTTAEDFSKVHRYLILAGTVVTFSVEVRPSVGDGEDDLSTSGAYVAGALPRLIRCQGRRRTITSGVDAVVPFLVRITTDWRDPARKSAHKFAGRSEARRPESLEEQRPGHK